MNTNLTQVTATTQIVPVGSPTYVYSLTLAAAAAVATAVFRSGGASGTIIHQLAAPVQTSVSWTAGGDPISASGLHVTVTGAGAVICTETTSP